MSNKQILQKAKEHLLNEINKHLHSDLNKAEELYQAAFRLHKEIKEGE